MKKMASLLFVCVTTLFSQTNKYDIKSGIVEYDIIAVSNTQNLTTEGTSVLIFKDFGKLELTDERLIHKLNGLEDEEERNITKISKNKVLTVDFNDEVIYSQNLDIDEDLANINNKEAFNQAGAKFLGNESILGYKCDVWELGEYKSWVYNGVILKQISRSSAMEQMQIAKNANFNIDIKDSKFKLPNFPIKNIDVIISEGED